MRQPKAETNLQVFRGSKTPLSPYLKNASIGCCDSVGVSFDKLNDVVRFDNALSHLNPTGGNEKFAFPHGSPSGAFETARNDIIEHINANGVGATISIMAIPNYAFVTGLALHIYAEEPGITFNVKTRNGLKLPTDVVKVVKTNVTQGCDMQRSVTDGTAQSFNGVGALESNYFIDIIGRSGNGEFALEADEIMLEVATMPVGGKIEGKFGFDVAVSYDVVARAERA